MHYLFVLLSFTRSFCLRRYFGDNSTDIIAKVYCWLDIITDVLQVVL